MTKNQKNSAIENLDSLDTILFELKKSINAKETVVFCGAGISFHSGIPLANSLVGYVLEKLSVSKDEIKTITESNLPFEAFMQILRGDCDMDRIFDIYDIGEPNTNHFLLAKLAKAKYLKTICTPNFDQLIEKALESEGMVRGDDFQVYYKEDDLERIDWNDNKIRLIKIHGSVEDRNNMAITLQHVATKVLSEQRMRVIEHIFSKGTHKNVLILGYSCSDVFDLSPQIEAIREKLKKVILIEHDEKKQAVKDIADKKEKNPFQNFTDIKWVLYNTDNLVKTLWNFYFPEDDYPEFITDKILWKKCVDDWSSETEERFTRGAKYNIIGTILLEISEYESAATYYEQALNIAKNINYKQGAVSILGNLGKVCLNLSNCHEAIAYHEQGLRIAREISDKQGIGYRLGDLGKAYDRLGDYHKAKEFYKQALSIARDMDDKKREGAWLGQLGNVYENLGNYHKAIEFYEQALGIAREIGNKLGEGSMLGSLGNTYHNLAHHKKAIAYHEQGLRIARDIGNKQRQGCGLGDLGNAHYGLGEFHKAIKFYEQALSITKDIGDKQGQGSGLGNLGNAYYSLGGFHKAIKFYEQALSITRDIGDKKHEGRWLGQLGNAYFSLGEFHKVTGFYKQALSIARDIGDKKSEGTWLGNLGNVYFSLSEFHKAIKFYEQALSIAREIDDKENEGRWLGNLGNTYYSLDGFHKAIKFYKQALSIARDIDDKQNEGTWLGNLGNTYDSLGEFHKAIEFYEQALVILRPMLTGEHPSIKLLKENLRRVKSLQ